MSLSFLEVSTFICVKTSYRDATDILNRFLGRNSNNSVKLRTLSDSIGRIGCEISQELSSVTSRILCDHGFDDETGLPLEGTELPDAIKSVSPTQVAEIDQQRIDGMIRSINDSREEKVPFSANEIHIEAAPSKCVYISIDDIGVKHQKGSRKDDSERGFKYIENTVAHIQYGDNSYVLTGIGMRSVFKSILAFLLINGLLSRELVFLTDGAKDLKSHIKAVFKFHPYVVVLDWFHLKKRCQERLSQSIRGKDRRNAVLEKVLGFLWVGDVSRASTYLSSLDASHIKSQQWLDDLLAYLERKSDSIACYALRSRLGLRNSSNTVEKANDLIVAQRQKHNGMSWSPDGSGSLAALQMIHLNQQADQWFRKKELHLLSDVEPAVA